MTTPDQSKDSLTEEEFKMVANCVDIDPFHLDHPLCEIIAQIKATSFERGKAEGLLKATETISKYALQTKSIGALNLIEQAQKEILSLPANQMKDE
jgi:hypothetical protein